tara:strand:+ start:3626 stop:3901 length:276 start_codon:yes stop_codon:yes gene_type:complete
MSEETRRLQKISASRGVVIVNDTNAVSRTFDAVMALEDTVIASLTVGGTNVRANYITTPATAIKAGALITGHNGDTFDGITLTSGSVSIIL